MSGRNRSRISSKRHTPDGHHGMAILSRFVAGFFCLSLGAQQNAVQPLRIAVIVTDRSGQLVPGLQQRDFTLLDNKSPQALLSFRAVDGATAGNGETEFAFVLDEVNTTYQIVAQERQQLREFLQRNNAKLSHPASLVFFSDKGTTMGTLSTRDGNSLIAALDGHENTLRVGRRSQGAPGAFERLQSSIGSLSQIAKYEAKRPGRKILIWISPGWALLTGPRIQLTNKNDEDIFRSGVTLSDELRVANITLYNVDPLGVAGAGTLRTSYYKEFLKPVKKPNEVHLGNLALQVLATQSGGLVLNSSNDLAAEMAHCFAEADTFYELTFDKMRAASPDEFHEIEVKLAKPGLTARTRYGYYGQP